MHDVHNITVLLPYGLGLLQNACVDWTWGFVGITKVDDRATFE